MMRRIPLLLVFGVFGMLFGVWQVVLPDLTLALDIDDAQLGLALTLGASASLPSMWLAGRAVDRFGAKRVLYLTAAVMAAAYIAFATIPAYLLLIVLLLFFYGTSGAFDIAINAAALTFERATGMQFMTTLHAAFSGGALIGALGTGALLAAGTPFNLLYLAVPVALAGTMLVVGRSSIGEGGAGAVTSAEAHGSRRTWSLILVALGIVAAMATLSEGALESWTAIYLRLTLGFPATFGVAGVAAFHAAMVVGRLTGGRVVAAIGRRWTLLAGGTLALVAMPLALVSDEPAIVLSGFFLVAIGLSSLFPIAISMAGTLHGGGGQSAATVMTLGYAGFLVGPALIGGIAGLTSLRLALLVVAAAGLVTILIAARPLRRIAE
ncbi:MAG: MFS transporter [Chloroflexota bacterium]